MAPPMTFHRFQDLPAELRLQVWGFALPERRPYMAVLQDLPVQNVTHVCHESRCFVMSSRLGYFWRNQRTPSCFAIYAFDASYDFLWLPHRLGLVRHLTSDFLQNVQRLALSPKILLGPTDNSPVPVGHEGIEGNEYADRLADSGARGWGGSPTGPALEPSLSDVRSNNKKTQKNITTDWYNTAEAKLKPRYLRWKVDHKLEETPELWLPRPMLARFVAMRYGHGDFKGYHEWRGHEPNDYIADCACGGSKSTDYLVHCRLSKSHRAAWSDADTPDDKYLLEVLSDAKKFKKFVELTDDFDASASTRTQCKHVLHMTTHCKEENRPLEEQRNGQS